MNFAKNVQLFMTKFFTINVSRDNAYTFLKRQQNKQKVNTLSYILEGV